MLKIKLARFGKKGQPHFRIVVTEARSKRDGKYSALLGHYAPSQNPKTLELDAKAYDEWVIKGAQPTPTVANLYKRVASGNPFPPKKARPSKKAIEKAKAAAVKPAEEAPVAAPEVVTPEVEETAVEAVVETATEAVSEATTE